MFNVNRLRFGAALTVLVLLVGMATLLPMQAQEEDLSVNTDNYEGTLLSLVGHTMNARNGANDPESVAFMRTIAESGDELYIAPLIDATYFMFRSRLSVDALLALSALTGLPETTDWRTYFNWAAENEVALPPGYDVYKGRLLGAMVDPNFRRFFEPGVQETAQVNLVEAVWGGVAVDGIPSLVNAQQVSPDVALNEGQTLRQFCRQGDCRYPAPDELVFGVALDGDARAYPLRLLNWHEMFNDVFGAIPMYATVDGPAICQFRAPNDLVTRGYDPESGRVQVFGESAGCPSFGWVDAESIIWDEFESTAEALETLPNTTEINRDILTLADDARAQVPGRPVMLAYCTLCGSGVLFDPTIEELTYTDLDGETVELGDTTLEFGSTGMLMRSNKLMYDRTTDTVWNALTGEPAFGPLATVQGLQLDLLPVVVTDWQTWQLEHPNTSVLSLDTGYTRNYTNGAAYSDYFNDPEFVMFPVFQQDEDEIANKDMVFGFRVGNEQKAYPLDTLIAEQVSNDTLGETELVLVTRATPERDFFEPGGAAVRAYARDGRTFEATEDREVLVDADGIRWQVTEDALVSEDGNTLERLPGQLAFWFGWFGFYPETLVYQSAP